jgi:hypothetical protein
MHLALPKTRSRWDGHRPPTLCTYNTPLQTAGGTHKGLETTGWHNRPGHTLCLSLHWGSRLDIAVGVPFYPSDLITHNTCFPALKRRSVCDSNWVGWGLVANVRGGNNSTIELSGLITSCTPQNEISLGWLQAPNPIYPQQCSLFGIVIVFERGKTA